MTEQPQEQPDEREIIKAALAILRTRWELESNWAVTRRLIEQVDKTVLQIAERKVKIRSK